MSSIEIIINFCRDLQIAKEIDRESIIMNAIAERLDKSLEVYKNCLSKDVEYLKFRKNLSVIRKLNK